MAKKQLDPAKMLENANTTAAREILATAEQENTNAPAHKIRNPKNAGRPKSRRICKLNITLTEEDKDFLRLQAFERTKGNHIVTISDIIAEYIGADRKKQERKAKK